MNSAIVTDLGILKLLEPYGGSRCAADILGMFRNWAKKEKPGHWFKARYIDLKEYLGNLYGRNAIARATKLLNDLGILLQHHHTRDGQIRTFYYEFRPEGLKKLVELPNETLEVPNETLEVPNETLEVPNETFSIYIDPHSLDPNSDPQHPEKEKENQNHFSEPELRPSQHLQNEKAYSSGQQIEDQGKCSGASDSGASNVPKKRTSEKEVWEIAPGQPYPVFLNWWAKSKYVPQGGRWEADALGNAYAEFYNNCGKTTQAIFPQFLEYMQKVTENCNQSLHAGLKGLLPSHFILRPEANEENVQHLMKRVEQLVKGGAEVLLPQSIATPGCTQSISFKEAQVTEISPLPLLEDPKKELTPRLLQARKKLFSRTEPQVQEPDWDAIAQKLKQEEHQS